LQEFALACCQPPMTTPLRCAKSWQLPALAELARVAGGQEDQVRGVAVAAKDVGEVLPRDRVWAAVVALEQQAELGVLVAVCPGECSPLG
jgi:hypothetical protein